MRLQFIRLVRGGPYLTYAVNTDNNLPRPRDILISDSQYSIAESCPSEEQDDYEGENIMVGSGRGYA